MRSIALLVDNKKTKRQLKDLLSPNYQLLRGRSRNHLPKRPFDVVILDVSAMDRLKQQIESLKEDLTPVELPVLLVAAQQDLDDPRYQSMRDCIDEIIVVPIDGRVLEVRLESLFQSKEKAIQIERSYHALSKTSLAGVVILQGRRIAFANQSVADMAGYSLDEFLQLTPQDVRRLVHPEDRRATLRLMHQIYRERTAPVPTQFRYYRKDGSIRWVEMLVNRIIYHGQSALQATAIDISERKEVLATLRERELALQKAQAVSHVGSWVWDIQSNHLEWSDEMYRIFGIRKDEFTGDLVDIIQKGIHPDDREAVNRSNQSVIEHKKPLPLEYRVIRPDGSIRTVWAEAGELIEDEKGQPAKLTGIVQDITDRKKFQAALELTQERLTSLYNSMQEAFTVQELVYDASGRSVNYVILEANPMYEKVLGLERDEVIGQLATDVYQVERAPYLGRYSKVVQTGKPTQFEAYYGPSDRHFHISAFRPAPDQFATVFTDISERKRMEEDLRESRRRLETLMDNLPGMAYRSLNHPDWPKEIVSLGCLELTGYPPEELLQSGTVKFGDLIHPDDRQMLWNEVQRALKHKRIFRLLYRIYTADNQMKWVLEQGQGVFGEDGQVVAIEGFITDITDRILAEKAVRQSEERYRRLTETTPDLILVHDPGGHITYINQAGFVFLGYTLEEIDTLTPEDLIPPEYMDDTAIRRSRRLSGDMGTFSYEMELINREGERLPVDVRSTPILHEGKVQGILLVARDITERKVAQQALEDSERKFREVVAQATDGIVMADSQGNVVEWNERQAEITGIGREEAIGKPIWQIQGKMALPGESSIDSEANREDIVRNLIQSPQSEYYGMTFENRIKRPDGVIRIVETSLYPIRSGEEFTIVSLVRDVTDRKKAEEERERLAKQIRDQAAELEQILETVPAGVVLLVNEGIIQQANPVAERALSTLANAKVGDRLTRLGDRPLHEILSPPPEGLWHEITASNMVYEVSARPMEEGSEKGSWVLVINDVTRDREIRKQLQQQGQLAAVGQLAAGIAHDFNNIIAIIGLYAELGLNTPALDKQIAERFEMIEQQAERAANLTQQIMDFSRSSVLKRQPMNLSSFFDEFGKLIKETLPNNIQIEMHNQVDTCSINADSTRLQQALLNLVLNARDAMQTMVGGNIQLTLSLVGLSEAVSCFTCGDILSGEWACITVEDHGSGIEPDVLTHIFEPFFTTKDVGQGTGLGLAQVYGIVKQHDGHIDVDSVLGHGTTFKIYLPISHIDPVVLESYEGTGRVFGRGERILVVEDSPVLRGALRETLELLNYEILEAENGEEALEMLETEQDIALVLSDLVMPGMGGQDMFQEIQERGLSVPVVMLSGHPMESEIARLQLEGLAGWLLKPPTPDQLAIVIAAALKGEASAED